MPTTLLVAEKPKVASKIAQAIGNYSVEENYGVKNYRLDTDQGEVIVAPAVGHIFTLEQQEGDWEYPVFEIEWVPAHESDDSADYIKKYVNNMKKMGEEADAFINGCDFDLEGSVIGATAIKYACNADEDRIKRMKFSTLTPDDLRAAFDDLEPFDKNQTEAGLTRHILDWYYGINLSRALMLAVKSQDRYQSLSTGRVQGPALKILADREREIQAFEPEDYWELYIETHGLEAQHVEGKFWDEETVDAIKDQCDGSQATVVDIDRHTYQHNPPAPFNLTDLQKEAYSQFNYDPKQTQQIAQSLYEDSLISYPRTSSQKLPKKIGYGSILGKLKQQDKYAERAQTVLDKDSVYPRQGKKEDDAHPAIHPTGMAPKNLNKSERKVYDLIVKRFLATFGDPAKRESLTLTFDVADEKFEAKGKRTLERNWYELYDPYVHTKEIELPSVEHGQELDVEDVRKDDKETQPPKRYTKSSLVTELEKNGLGTKCLTGDQKVTVIQHGEQIDLPMKELFEQKSTIRNENLMQIVQNNKTKVISRGNGFQSSEFAGVSKRKLKDNECVYKITFKDGTAIKATGNHPILVHRDGECGYAPVEHLEAGEKAIRAHRGSKETSTLLEFDQFVSELDETSSLYGNLDLKRFRDEHGLSQHDVAAIVETSQSTVHNVEKRKLGLLRYWQHLNLPEPTYLSSENFDTRIRNPFPIKDSPALSRLLGMLQGDGSLDNNGAARENKIDYRYHNTDKELLRQFQEDMEQVFDYRPEIRQHDKRDGQKERFYLRVPAVIGRIIHIISDGLTQSWIEERNHTEHYLAALIADEGHISPTEPKAFISNKNHDLLKSCQQILADYDIDTRLDTEQHKLHIAGRESLEQLLENIPIYSTRKHQALIDLLERHYKHGKDQSCTKTERDVLIALQDSKKTLEEIGDDIDRSVTSIKGDLSRLREKGYAEKIIEGVSERPRKKIYYRATVAPYETFYSEIGEQAIGSGHTATVASIEELNYNGYVYDVLDTTNGNFMTENNVIVHNSTRANIVDSLYNRKYITDSSIQVTDLGMAVIESLEDYCPNILSPELTREFEQAMEAIRDGDQSRDEVLEKARDTLGEILDTFEENEDNIGEQLIDAVDKTRRKERQLGPCDECEDGTLRIIKTNNGRFVGCSNYPDCENSYPLPKQGSIKSLDELCDECGRPRIHVKRNSGKNYSMCIYPDCATKDDWD